MGGSIVFFVLAGDGAGRAGVLGIVHWPITASFFFLGIVVAMGYEISRDALRAAQLARELRRKRRADDPGGERSRAPPLGMGHGRGTNFGPPTAREPIQARASLDEGGSTNSSNHCIPMTANWSAMPWRNQ